MPDLRDSIVFRGPSTAEEIPEETRECSVATKTSENAIEIGFRLAASRGITAVQVRIGLDGLRMILERVANDMPEESVSMLSDCAALASKRVFDRFHEDKARARNLLGKEVEDLQNYVSEIHYDSDGNWRAPQGNDDREASVVKQMNEVERFLRDLSRGKR